MTAGSVFALALCVAAGSLVADAVSSGRGEIEWVLGAGGLCLALLLSASLARGARARSAAVLSGAVLVGFTLAGLRFASLNAAVLARGGLRGADAIVTGEVLERPKESGGALRFAFGVNRATIDGRPFTVRERVQVSIRPPPRRPPAPGDRMIAHTRLAPLGRDSPDAGARAYARHLRRAGMAARAYARPDDVRRVGRSRNPIVAIAGAGQRAAERAAAALPPRLEALLLGVTIGDDSRLEPGVEEDFRATGLSHLLAVSGGNLAIFLGAIAAGLFVLRARRRTRVAVLGAATLAFMAITRFEPSVLRAGAMVAVALTALAAGARRHTLHSLGVACLGLLVWDPMLVHSGGFQLSALATFGVLAIAPRLAASFGGGRVAAAVAISLGAQLAVAPLVALRFNQASLVALPANLLAVPAVAPATVLGFAAAGAGALFEPAGRVVALGTAPFLWWTERVALVFARIPQASVTTPSGPSALAVVAGLIVLAAAAVRAKRIRVLPFGIACVLALLAVSAWSTALAPPNPPGLRIVGLQVGQGDAVLVRARTGQNMLVDGGPDPRRLLQRLRANGVRSLDVVVLTHSHADHVDGLLAAIDRYPVGIAIDAGEEPGPASSSRFPGYLRRLETRRIPRRIVRAGATFALGDARVRVLGPSTLFEGTDSDPNNNSVVLRVEYGSQCALLTGDAQEEAQDALIESPGSLSCPVLKAPHHGSRRVRREFFAATKARFAFVCVGANPFGHPAAGTLRLMGEMGMRAFRTDRDGDVAITIGSDGRIHATRGRNRPAA